MRSCELSVSKLPRDYCNGNKILVGAPITATKHAETLRRVQADTKLQELERDLLLLLLSQDPKARLSRGFEVVQAIDDVIVRLGQPVQLDANSYLANRLVYEMRLLKKKKAAQP